MVGLARLARRLTDQSRLAAAARSVQRIGSVPVSWPYPAAADRFLAYVRRAVPPASRYGSCSRSTALSPLEGRRGGEPGICGYSVSRITYYWLVYALASRPSTCDSNARWTMYYGVRPGALPGRRERAPVRRRLRAGPPVRYLLGPVAGMALVLLAGHGLLRLTSGCRPHRAFGIVLAVGLSWFAGVAVLGALTTLVGVLGLTTRPLPVLAPVLALLALAGLLHPARLASTPAGTGPTPPTSRRPAGRTWLGTWSPPRAPCCSRPGSRRCPPGIPASANDEYALWMLRARALSQLGGLDPRVFVDGSAGYQHQEYPLFVPALFSWLDSWAGRPSDPAAHVAAALTCGALLAVAGGLLTRLAGPAAAAAGLLLLVSVPTLLATQTLRLMADVTVFSFAFCLTLVLLLVVTDPRRAPARPWLAVTAVLGAGAVGSKSEGLAFAAVAFAAGLLVATGRRRGVLLAGAAALAVNLPWIAYSRAHHLSSWVANQDTLSLAHLRSVLPWTGHVARGMVEQWPGGSWTGVLLAVAALVAGVLAVRAGHWRPVVLVTLVVTVSTGLLLAQYVATAYGPPSDPRAGPLLDSQLTVTVFRVALLPAALLAVAGPLFAGLALRPRYAGLTAVPADEHEVRQEPVPAGLGRVGDDGPGIRRPRGTARRPRRSRRRRSASRCRRPARAGRGRR